MPYETERDCPHGSCCSMCCDRCQSGDSRPLPRGVRLITIDDGDGERGYYDSGNAIQDHGYRPPLVFHGKGWHMGMELEVHAPEQWVRDSWGSRDYDYDALERMARDVQEDLGDLCWLQEDGSVSYGFELTTHPMTYRWALKHFPWAVLEDMSDKGFWVDNGVGIHVHVSREAFASECHLYRWMKFVYRNATQVQVLARRRSSEWASFSDEYRTNVKWYAKGRGGYTRYMAINPNNPATLEVRVFASSLRPSEVKAALAFTASSVEYTRGLDANKVIKERGWAWSSYVDWLRQPAQDIYRPVLDELEALLCVS